MIKATDPSGAVGRATVTVNLKDVNESPVFTAPSKGQDTLYIDENVTGDALTLRTSEADIAANTPSCLCGGRTTTIRGRALP